MSPSNGAGAGSPSTPRAWRSRWPAPASWARAIPTTCSPTAAKASSKRPRSRALRHRAADRGDIRQGFVYERVPHITLKSIANNAEIDVIWEKWQAKLEPLREAVEQGTAASPGRSGRSRARPDAEVAGTRRRKLHAEWWQARIARQKEIDASIAAKAEFEYLYDKPYDDKKRVRVAGPFTVESLSPHRVLGVDENDELIDGVAESTDGYGEERDFVQMILENLKTAGRAAGAQGGQDHLHLAHALAGRSGLRRRPLYRGRRRVRQRETRRHLHRPGVRHRLPPRSGGRRARGRRCRLRCADRLRFQLRRPRLGVRQARPHPRAQGAHERRPAHGRRSEEHRQGQPLRDLRRAGHRHPRRQRMARSR